MPNSFATTLLVGFLLGVRHAVDVDHVVAVSALVAREKSFWRSTRIGAIWGLGHTVTLFVMGILIVVLGLHLPEKLGPWLEASVAAMLIYLGTKGLWNLKAQRGHFCTHHHQGGEHTHFHLHGEHACAQNPNAQNHTAQNSRQSFWVGMVHGLSGSAELMLLILATIRHPLWALAYIVVFGCGMMIAMFAITSALSYVLAWTSKRDHSLWTRFDHGLRTLTSLISLAFGCYLCAQMF